jgi:hypothetical protein
MAVPITAVPGVFNNYNPTVGQPTYYPQPVMLVPVPATGMPMSPTGYPQMGQPTYYPQPVMLVPVPATGMPMSPNGYPQMGQPAYYPPRRTTASEPRSVLMATRRWGQPDLLSPRRTTASEPSRFLMATRRWGQRLTIPKAYHSFQNPVGFNGYPADGATGLLSPKAYHSFRIQSVLIATRRWGQPAYYPPSRTSPYPAPPTSEPESVLMVTRRWGQPAYYPQAVPLPQNPVGFNGYPADGATGLLSPKPYLPKAHHCLRTQSVLTATRRWGNRLTIPKRHNPQHRVHQ